MTLRLKYIVPVMLLALGGCDWPSDAALTRWAQVAELGIAAASGDPRILFVVFADRGLDATGRGYQDRRDKAAIAVARARAGEVTPDRSPDLTP